MPHGGVYPRQAQTGVNLSDVIYPQINQGRIVVLSLLHMLKHLIGPLHKANTVF